MTSSVFTVYIVFDLYFLVQMFNFCIWIYFHRLDFGIPEFSEPVGTHGSKWKDFCPKRVDLRLHLGEETGRGVTLYWKMIS